ncbi:MAG: zinc-binding dehydrogenase [Halioglobus sp.]|nr:zinc-binding dehydrogenase [Halioglobus sp.]
MKRSNKSVNLWSIPTLTGSTLRAQTFAQKAAMKEEIMQQVYPRLGTDGICPIVDRIFALEDAEDAQSYMLSGEHMGKIVMTVTP